MRIVLHYPTDLETTKVIFQLIYISQKPLMIGNKRISYGFNQTPQKMRSNFFFEARIMDIS